MITELTPELIDQIIFSMENQNEYFYLNLEQGIVEPERQVDPAVKTNEERYVVIPRWSSADGFHLMEKFVDSLRNPVFRERLREALASGRGVFRKFKNILKERDEIQRLWFLFKEREMRARVVEWYDQIRDAWGYAKIGPEPVETDELVLTDFVIETASAELLDRLEELDKKAFAESWPDDQEELVHLHYLARQSLIPQITDTWFIFHAVTPAAETAGFIWGVDTWLGKQAANLYDETPAVTFLLQLYVMPDFRGLGLARLLLDTYIRKAYQREMRTVLLDLWGGAQSVDRILNEYGFRAVRSSWHLDLEKWGREELIQ